MENTQTKDWKEIKELTLKEIARENVKEQILQKKNDVLDFASTLIYEVAMLNNIDVNEYKAIEDIYYNGGIVESFLIEFHDGNSAYDNNSYNTLSSYLDEMTDIIVDTVFNNIYDNERVKLFQYLSNNDYLNKDDHYEKDSLKEYWYEVIYELDLSLSEITGLLEEYVFEKNLKELFDYGEKLITKKINGGIK